MKKIIATDMDGTFLNHERSFDHKRLNQLLDDFMAKEYLFVAASGRSLVTLEILFQGFEDKMALIAENGSVVKLFGKIISEDTMSKELYLKLISKLEECPYLEENRFLLSGKQGSYVKSGVDRDYLNHIRDYYDNVQEVDDFESITDSIFKLTANFTPELVESGQDWVNQEVPEVTAVTTGFESIDIILNYVDKSTGLRHLMAYLGNQPEDIIAFGDNLNDKEMLEFAGYAIATENARDDIKAISDQVIGHCKDESVMYYMEGMIGHE